MATDAAMSHMYRTKEAAEFLGINESTLSHWRCAGIGPPYYMISARRVLYDQADLEKFKLERRVVPSMRSNGRL